MTKSNQEEIREKVLKGLELTYKRLLQHKLERNLDVVISENGKVKHVNPKDLM